MMTFIKNAMDWILEKEQEAAQNCHANPEDIEKQIQMIETKKEGLEKRCKEEIGELEHLLNRLHTIKAQSLKCHHHTS
jgi:hypothetical protein